MPTLEQMKKRQQALARFGEFALQSEDLDEVLCEACRQVAEALGTRRAKILEIDEESRTLLVRAGVGWAAGVVGELRLSLDERSSETFAIRKRRPIFSRDVREEARFDIPEFMKEAGVVALVNVPLFLPRDRAFGLLQVDSTEQRDFGEEEIEFLRIYATILGPVIDRLRKLSDLRETRELFRLIVESARDYAIFVTDAEGRITHWFPGAQAVFGWTAEEAQGQTSSITFTPEDRAKGKDEKELTTARENGVAPDVRWHLRKDGSRVFVYGAVTALRDADGALQGFAKIAQDVTKRHEAERALEASRRQLQTLVEGIPQLVWRSGDGGEWLWSSPQWSRFTGLSQGESAGLGWLDAIHPDDRDDARRAWREASRDARLAGEWRIREAATGRYRWFATRASPVQTGEDRVREWFGTSTDVDELRKLQDAQKVLVSELQHRTRNLLGVVSSIAIQTAGNSASLADFSSRFAGRIAALSRVQGLLSRAEQEPVDIRTLIDLELAALAADALGDRIELAGPKALLESSTVQTLALALHELATNARKYGGLAGDVGRLSVTWAIVASEDDSRQPVLRVEWLEQGAPLADQNRGRKGYGRELIEDALPYALGARTSFELREDGVRCVIELPQRDFGSSDR
ncbi:PAS domain S-box protein [Hansschlegelia sp.]|uniref:PAS domain S-box protein n=1 Tax=Hansschlegelia sp. TaxID=2041892 RepID=UPI002D1E15A6|nr:PAS domain S-box protein [Hansschlegelia sp.]HVI28659.1 PAS domain S-box protein [Hansschlegelia sp.]